MAPQLIIFGIMKVINMAAQNNQWYMKAKPRGK